VIFIGLIFYVYFYEIIGEKKRIAEEEEKNKVFHSKRNDVETIIVERPEIKMTFKKRDQNWWIESPVNYKGDDMNINSLLSQIEIAENEGIVSETGEDSESFGLAPPQMKLYIMTKEKRKDSLLIGYKNPVGNAVFAQRTPGNEIFLTNYMMSTYMQKSLFEFREKKLLEIDKNDVNRIVLTYPNKTFELKKVAFKEWEIQKPNKYPADLPVITAILDKFDDAKIKKFIDEKPKNLNKYGLNKPMIRLDLFFEKDASKKSLMIGSNVSEEDKGSDGEELYYAKNEVYDPVIGIEKSIADILVTNLFILRNKMVVNFLREDVRKIVLDYKDKHFICVKDSSNKWFFGEDMSVSANQEKAEDIITKARSMRASRFIDYDKSKLSQYGFTNPQMEIIFNDKDDKEIESLAFGKITGNTIYLINKTKNLIFLVDSNKFYELEFQESELKENKETSQM